MEIRTKTLLTIICVLLIAVFAACDMRSGIAKDEMEKFVTKPTPPIAPTPAEIPIDPADAVEVDISVEGDPISINIHEKKKTAACPKFNRIKVNGYANVITITGVCQQIMINGDRNDITADAAMEFVFNGSDNIVKYSRFPNGKRPLVTDNGPDNSAEKIAAGAVTGNQSNRKIVK